MRSKPERIVDALLFDLDGRRGFDLCGIDSETMDELRETWAAIIERELAAKMGEG